MIRAVLIDLDGTLLDTVDDIAAAGNAMLAEIGRPPLPRETSAMYVGRGAQSFVARALSGDLHVDAHGDIEPAELAARLERFMVHYRVFNGRFATLYPQVREGIAAMHGAGLKLALVTNKPRELSVALLDQFDLAKDFSAVVAGGDTERKKPDAQPLQHACAQLGVATQEAVMLGDSLNDVQAGRAAACRTLLLPYGYNEGRPIAGEGADAIVTTLLDAAHWIAATTS
jgi:phosphoglycolate phosphatase